MGRRYWAGLQVASPHVPLVGGFLGGEACEGRGGAGSECKLTTLGGRVQGALDRQHL